MTYHKDIFATPSLTKKVFANMKRTSAKVKKVNDEIQIQALVDGKRVNIKEYSIRHILRLDDAEGTSCLTNTKIFKSVPRMGAKTTSWNEFSSTMASAIICLTTNQEYNFSWYILLSLVKNIEVGVLFFMFPREFTLLFDNMLVQAPKEVGILQADVQPIPIPIEPSTSKPQKKHKPKRKHTKELKDSLKLKELMDLCTNLSNKVLDLESEVIDIKSTYKAKIEKLESRVERLEEKKRVLKGLKGVHSTVDSDEPVMKKEESSKQGKKISDIDADVEINLEKVEAEEYNLDLDHQEKVLSMLDVNDEEHAGVEEVLEVVKAAKLITEVVTTDRVDVNAASVQDTLITAAEATKVIVEVPKLRKRRDDEVARELEEELNADINWNDVIKQVQRSERLIDAVMKYQALKRKPLTKAKAMRNMIVYLKNIVGYKMNYLKGMSYDEIIPLFEKHYNYNQAFLNELNEGIKVPEKKVRQEKEVEVESSKREGESLEQEITKKQKKKQETVELKKLFQIVPDDDDVYADATSLASKIPIVDYKITLKETNLTSR
uniref:Synaptobrevin, longin-like domain protein n=1 Tax=Tanacetum cinerariifolium TaxID=118510 RepID=A0A699KIE9_TANCI|nr:hypothetical protein [Tanacetum cinerariifolium]